MFLKETIADDLSNKAMLAKKHSEPRMLSFGRDFYFLYRF